MKQWDTESIGKQFGFVARSAEIYAREWAGRFKADPANATDYRKELHDEHLAKSFVYDSFVGKSCLESRESFLVEVKARLASGIGDYTGGSFNKEHFHKYWRQYMNALLTQYETD